MKRLIITSIAATLIIGGSVFIMNKNVTEPVNKGNVGNYKVIPEKTEIVNDDVKTDAVIETVSEPTAETVEPVETIITKDYNQLMLDNFIKQPNIYMFIDKYLKVQYPDKFTDDNLQPTIAYLVDYFATNNNVDMSSIKQTFTW